MKGLICMPLFRRMRALLRVYILNMYTQIRISVRKAMTIVWKEWWVSARGCSLSLKRHRIASTSENLAKRACPIARMSRSLRRSPKPSSPVMQPQAKDSASRHQPANCKCNKKEYSRTTMVAYLSTRILGVHLIKWLTMISLKIPGIMVTSMAREIPKVITIRVLGATRHNNANLAIQATTEIECRYLQMHQCFTETHSKPQKSCTAA